MSEVVSTRDRILDAAERLFAQQGVDATSLRAITAEAGANLAAVNYYFQSKEILIREVLGRRIGPINERRLALLDACEANAGDGPLPLEPVLEAFFLPVLSVRRTAPNIVPLLGRLYSEPGRFLQYIYRDHMEDVVRRFVAAFHRALPELAQPELLWRIHFMIGALAHTMSSGDLLEAISNGQCDPADYQGTLARLVSFFSAALRSAQPMEALHAK